MVAFDGFWPRNVELLRRVSIQTVVSIVASAFLTSVMIVLFVGVDTSRTITFGDLWRIGLSISTIAPALICPFLALLMSKHVEGMRRTHEELVNLAWRDSLTGWLNRRGFDGAAAHAIAEARRSGQPIAALMCDIDLFKALNDACGHDVGDTALRTVAQTIQMSVRGHAAVLGRQGGDEFAILLPGVDIEEAARIAEGLRVACEAQAFDPQDCFAQLTISIGAAADSSDEAQLGSLLGRADAALYRAKRAGGNLVVPAPAPSVPERL